MVQNSLFNTKGELLNYFKKRKSKLEVEIESTDPGYLLNVRFENFSQYLISKYSLDPPKIYEDDIYVYNEQEVEIDVSHDRIRLVSDRSRPFYVKGITVTIAIPFDNDDSFFEYRPSTFTYSPPPGEIIGQEVHLIYRLVAKHPLHKNHALHLPVPHPQFSRTSGDNSTTHTILP